MNSYILGICSDMTGMKHRILKCASRKQTQHSVAFARFGVIRHIYHRNLRLGSSILSCCLFYAGEIWTLDIKTRRSIRSWYCRKMSLITERSYRDEYASPTTDVIQLIRIRRAKWLKLNLTYNSKSLVVQVLRRQSLQNRTKGDVFFDMPNVHFDALKDKLNDGKEWEKIIKFIKSDSAGDP